MGFVLFYSNSCKKDDNKNNNNNNNNNNNAKIPAVSTYIVSDIGQTKANCGGIITSDSGSTVTIRGVCWSTGVAPTISDNKTTDGSGAGTYTSSMTGLAVNTTYYVRAYATNIGGTGYGSAMSFTTLDGSLPVLTTENISNISQTSATSGGNISFDGGYFVTSRGVCWSTLLNPTIADSHTTDGNGTGIFISNITGLSGGTVYYVRAYATNNKGTIYGNALSFTTCQLPNLTTSDVINITTNSALSGGFISSDGGYPITARGICWSTNQNPTIVDSHTSNGTGFGSFSSNITGLTSETLYYVRAYATNSIGTAYGNSISFTTISTISIGQPYQGGIIFYLLLPGDPGYIAGQKHGLIVCEGESYTTWGCIYTEIGGTSVNLGTGQANTTRIVNGCGTSGIAARICNDLVWHGYNDWFLPSRAELKLLYNSHLLPSSSNEPYCTSSEYDSYSHWVVYSYDGYQSHKDKNELTYVRAIRTF